MICIIMTLCSMIVLSSSNTEPFNHLVVELMVFLFYISLLFPIHNVTLDQTHIELECNM